MELEEILLIDDIDKKISYLKRGRRTAQPDTEANYAMWDIAKHEIIWNKDKYPDRKVKVREEQSIFNEKTGKQSIIEAQFKDVEVNRIAVPIEQDIVNIQTAFTVGLEPTLDCTPEGEEQTLLEALKVLMRKNKIKYQNKKIVRSWLSEQEVAEYWYAVKDDNFWSMVWKKIKHPFAGTSSTTKLKSVLWSPFRGDKVYPFFDDSGDMVAFSREYKKKDIDNNEITCFMTITRNSVFQWELTSAWEQKAEKSFKHGFIKLPVIYSYRSDNYCKKIQPVRTRIENILSSYADCMDQHFFPLLKLVGDVIGFTGKKRDNVVNLTNGADAQYLTWNQAPDTVKLELEKNYNIAYDMTNTPRITFEELKGLGKTSGTAFEFMFMGAHMAVSNHAEVIGDFMQRRVNFLISALGDTNSELYKASQTIDVETELRPYIISDLADKVALAVSATGGPVWSKKDGIIYAGNADHIDETLKEIEESTMNLKNLKSNEPKEQ
ncbi:MAG: phage portal protein [Bacteroidales bacterium]